jgi:hypothetical protein
MRGRGTCFPPSGTVCVGAGLAPALLSSRARSGEGSAFSLSPLGVFKSQFGHLPSSVGQTFLSARPQRGRSPPAAAGRRPRSQSPRLHPLSSRPRPHLSGRGRDLLFLSPLKGSAGWGLSNPPPFLPLPSLRIRGSLFSFTGHRPETFGPPSPPRGSAPVIHSYQCESVCICGFKSLSPPPAGGDYRASAASQDAPPPLERPKLHSTSRSHGAVIARQRRALASSAPPKSSRYKPPSPLQLACLSK